MPATLYLTSCYYTKDTPVFGLAVAYIFWKSSRESVDLSGMGIPEFEDVSEIYFSPDQRQTIGQTIVTYGDTLLDEPGRVALSHRLADRLGIDYERIVESRILSLISKEELAALHDSGIRMGMHTHRHRFSLDSKTARAEIEDNRASVEPVTGQRAISAIRPATGLPIIGRS